MSIEAIVAKRIHAIWCETVGCGCIRERDKPCPDCAFCVCGHARAAHDTLDSGAYVCRYAGCGDACDL